MSWEKWIVTIALQMDSSCTAVLPISRMYDVSSTWSLGIKSDSSSLFDYMGWILSMESGKVVWLTLDQFFFIIHISVQQIRDEIQDGSCRQVGMMMDGLAGGILPSWEGVLKLATRAKLHLGQLIWWRWYFCWIPLSERCKIDLKILFGWAEVGFWIYFSHVQIVKVS